MNVKELKEVFDRLDDDTEVLVWEPRSELQLGTRGISVETDMQTGAMALFVHADNITRGNLRDFEPHPGFEDINKWTWE